MLATLTLMGGVGCQSVTLRPLETPLGPAMEIVCATPGLCGKEAARLSCPASTKTIHPMTETHWVVTCSPDTAVPQSPASGDPLAERGPTRASTARVPRDPMWNRNSRLSIVGPTPAMFRSAAATAEVGRTRGTQLHQLASVLGDSCNAGNRDDCVAALDLTKWSALPGWSETPARELRALRARARQLIELCNQRHAPACHRLGELAHVLAHTTHVQALALSGGLQTTLEQALRRDPRLRSASASLASLVTTDLKRFGAPDRERVRQWSTACSQGWASTCLMGATLGWVDAEGYDDAARPEVAAPPQQQAEVPVAHALARHCKAYQALCADAREHEYAAGLIDRAGYCASLDQLCAVANPEGCSKLATAVSNSTCASPPTHDGLLDIYRKACQLGSSQACTTLVEISLKGGAPAAALGYALQACQSDNEAGCQILADRFGRSRRYTDEATGQRLLEHACGAGYLAACYDVYVAQYLSGSAQASRQNLFKLCVNHEHVRSCRAVAQIDWAGGRADAAQSVLERQCLGDADDRDSCVELGALLAHRSEHRRATAVLNRECQRHQARRSMASEQRVCGLALRVEHGFVPQALGDIFLEPMQGSRDLLD